MKASVSYNVPLIPQNFQECVQASATQLLQYFGKKISIENVRAEVPVYISKAGEPLGTSLGHIAAYFVKKGLHPTLHTADMEIFDRTWVNKSMAKILELLRERRPFVRHHKYDDEAMDTIFDGYSLFLKAGGSITFPQITREYLKKLLAKGPIFAVVHYNYFHSAPKFVLTDEKTDATADAIHGVTSSHAIVVHGYDTTHFFVTDPDVIYGGKKEVTHEHLVSSILLADTEMDSLVLSFQP